MRKSKTADTKAAESKDPGVSQDNELLKEIERLKAENAAYLKHFNALEKELRLIRLECGPDGDCSKPDKLIADEITTMREGIAEIKSALAKMTGGNNTQTVANPQFCPSLPYYQTPNYAPQMPAMPSYNINLYGSDKK